MSDDKAIAARIRYAEERVSFFSWFLAISVAPVLFAITNIATLTLSGVVAKLILTVAFVALALAVSLFAYDLAGARSYLTELLRIQASAMPDTQETLRQLRAFSNARQAATDAQRVSSMSLFPLTLAALIAGYVCILLALAFALWATPVQSLSNSLSPIGARLPSCVRSQNA